MHRFRALWPCSLLLPLVLAGCSDTPYDGDNMAEPRPVMTVLREAAGEYLKGKAESRQRDALRRVDAKAFRDATEDYDWAEEADKPPQEAADRLVQKADNLFSSSRQLTEPDRSAQLLQADSKYRLALKFYPRMATESEDRDLLNSVGYYLADKGTSEDDFKQAETLTRRALRLWDPDPSQPALSEEDRKRRAQEPMDSLAWALFRQRRYKEARVLSEESLRTLRSLGPETEIDAFIPFHLAEIYRALGETAAAQREYAIALRNAQSVETEERVQSGLAALRASSPRPAGTPPIPTNPRP